jgi:hypothetical protein
MANNANCRFRGKRFRHSTKLSWRPPVVAIQEGDNLSAAFGNTHIECRGLSPVRLTQNTNLGSKASQDLRSAIGGPVVYNKNFAVGGGKILLQHAANCLFDEEFVIVCVDDYSEEGYRH